MNWRRMLGHRFVAVPLALAVVIAGWNVYIAFNDDGLIDGEVQDVTGRPVQGASVVFFERNFINYQAKQRVVTDERGRFRFTGMQVHVGQLEAQSPDGRRSQRHQLRLWFRAQNTALPPLIVEAPRS